ncbi:MAG: hypothetical protein R2991_05115 [Thermoanaerobaculia bacterium]
MNDAGVVAFDLDVVPGADADALWVGGDGAGQIVYTSPEGSLLSGVDVNAEGVVVFEQIFSSQDGLWLFDPDVGSAAFETSQPLGATFWSSPEIDAMERIGYRAAFGSDHAWVSYDGTASPAVHAVEAPSTRGARSRSSSRPPSTDSAGSSARCGSGGRTGG